MVVFSWLGSLLAVLSIFPVVSGLQALADGDLLAGCIGLALAFACADMSALLMLWSGKEEVSR